MAVGLSTGMKRCGLQTYKNSCFEINTLPKFLGKDFQDQMCTDFCPLCTGAKSSKIIKLSPTFCIALMIDPKDKSQMFFGRKFFGLFCVDIKTEHSKTL